jgi:hypothetical protein
MVVVVVVVVVVVLFAVVSPVVVVAVLLLRRMWTRGPGKRIVAAPMRTKVPLVLGAWERGAARERVAVVVLLLGGR